MTLDDIGIVCGTDKSSLGQGYLPHYERLFGHWRGDAFNLIEVGVAGGASLKTWAEYFPNATIVGIDIAPGAEKFAGDRIHIRIGSQADPDFLGSVAAEFPPRLVIDDGSHRADHQMASFDGLFPKLLPGGCYVCEDLTAFGAPRFLGNSAILGIDYFSGIARALMGRAAPIASAAGIARGDIIPGAVAIWKADTVAPLADIERKTALAERSPHPQAMSCLAHYLVRHGDPAEAVRAARLAAERMPNNPWTQAALARALKKAGDAAGAIAAAERAVSLHPHQPAFATLLETLRK
jgi:tetratricopeptide repeat protein